MPKILVLGIFIFVHSQPMYLRDDKRVTGSLDFTAIRDHKSKGPTITSPKESGMTPLITALLGKGLNLVANAVLAKGKDYIQDKTGIDLNKASLSEQDIVALKKFEMEHEEELMKLQIEDNRIDLEMTKALLADTEGARGREVRMAESATASWLNKNTGPILGIITICVTFWLFYEVLFDPKFLKEIGDNKEILLYILGVLSAIVAQIFSFYFGSSSGSKSKSEDLSRVLEGMKKGGQ
jgi:hypothetical protein